MAKEDTMDIKMKTVSENVDSNEKYPADLDQALAVAGIGWSNLKYCLVLALFLIAAIIEPVGYSYVLPAAKCDLNMTDAQRGFIASIPYIGIVITSFPWGFMVDTQGRKRTIILSAYASGLFAILAAFMPELISFIVCKFICALCIAAPAAIPYTFIGEIIPERHRDLTLSVVNAMQICGSALVPLLAWAILPTDFRVDFGLYEFRPWRLLTIVNGVFFIIAATLMTFGPESPKYLVTQGKTEEALQVLQNFYAGNKNKSTEDYPIKMLKVPEGSHNEKRSFFKTLQQQSMPLIKPPYLKWMLLIGFLLFGVMAVLNGLYVWVPDILNRVISGAGEGQTACDVIRQRLNSNQTTEQKECDDHIATSTFMINSIANSCCALIAVVGSSSVKIIGKKALIVIVFAIIGIFCISINFITNDMLFAAFLSTFPLMGMAIGPINAFGVEIFPTQLRGMAISLAMMIGRLGSVVGTNVAGALLNTVCEATFYVFGGLMLLCSLSTFLLPRSRKQ